jgi:tetratricopeptide (TPR) repeat protein
MQAGKNGPGKLVVAIPVYRVREMEMRTRRQLISVVTLAACWAATPALRAQFEDLGRDCVRGIAISPDGRNVEAIVRLEGFAFSATSRTSPSGQFAFCGLRHASYVLTVSAPGFETLSTPAISETDGANGLTIHMQPSVAATTRMRASNTVGLKSLQIPPAARSELVRFLRQAEKKDWQKSLASLHKAVEIYPDYVDAWVNMGTVYMQLNEFERAEGAFRQALGIEPQNPLIHRKLGYLYLAQSSWERALGELVSSESLNRVDPLTQAYLGYVLTRMDRTTDAIGHLTRALEAQPDMPMALYALGFAQIRLNQPEQAMRSLQRFVDRYPDSPSAADVRQALSKLLEARTASAGTVGNQYADLGGFETVAPTSPHDTRNTRPH